MNRKLILIFLTTFLSFTKVVAQCPTCGNGIVDAGETTITCPMDFPHDPTCISPCGQPTAFESTTGIRIAHDFTGTTTYSTTGLPAGWSFAGAPSPTTAGVLPAADVFGAKGGLVQPSCSGSCTATNFFCIGNLANSIAVGAGGTNGKLGANFDGRANTNQNSSYAILRGQNNPTLVSETFNMSAVEGFKIQFWLAASETSCGQLNSWGSCVGNAAFLDFSSNGGTSWTQIMTLNISSTGTDMCTSNSTNTLWFQEGAWSRVCLTVFKSTTSPGNFYTAATATTAASGIMVNAAYFTANFKFRIRYAQTASCSTATATNPGRYLAIDYPVITSGNEMIPCGISFSNMCGYGTDNNDDEVGSSTLSTNAIVFGTTRSSVNQAERGVEIFSSQSPTFGAQNFTGTSLPSNFDLCNAEGGDKQCINWQSNNNGYFAVYECITDWEVAGSNNIIVNYYKGTTPVSFNLTKVTTAGKTALKGWRMSGSRFVNCSTGDLNPGCNGYSFRSGSLPTQFARGFYALATNSLGDSWSFYGASSCSHYFNGPQFAPIAVPDTLTGAGNYVTCVGSELFFTGISEFCVSTGFTGAATLEITGPGGFSETINSSGVGLTPITTAGEYIIKANTPNTPTQCIDCGKSVCITVSQTLIDNCATALPITLVDFKAYSLESSVELNWKTLSEQNSAYFLVQRSLNGEQFTNIDSLQAAGESNSELYYESEDKNPLNEMSYYRLKMVDLNGLTRFSSMLTVNRSSTIPSISPNPSSGIFNLSFIPKDAFYELTDLDGKIIQTGALNNTVIDLSQQAKGIYFFTLQLPGKTIHHRLVKE